MTSVCHNRKLLEEILDRRNLNKAYKKVKSNKGSHGIDNMQVEELFEYLMWNGQELRRNLQTGNYKPKPVRRVEIPKPDGGKRNLGIPTVTDRMVQQAITQILSPIFDKQFSERSYGFRPGRSARQAVRQSREYIKSGYKWVVDIDLEKYFDTVNHDKLIQIISETIKDGRVVSLIRKYLQSGVMLNGVVRDSNIGTPQGGNLSPLLSNIMLNELDKELEKRGLRFCRYADDSNIYVSSKRAAERVMQSITRFIEDKLRLKVNKEKSSVKRANELKFLGFTFPIYKGKVKIGIHKKSIVKLKNKIREITDRVKPLSLEMRIVKLKQIITGWVNYYNLAETLSVFRELDGWTRRRLRQCIWKNWKRTKTRIYNLLRLGISSKHAHMTGGSSKGNWHLSNSRIVRKALDNQYFGNIGYTSFLKRYALRT